MKINDMNKRAGEKLLSIWWVFVLVLISGTLVIAVAVYYTAEINVNRSEAEILAQKVILCISDNGHVNEKININSMNDIFEKCHINKSLFLNGSSFYLKVEVFDMENKNLINSISVGDNSFMKDCPIQDKISAKHYPRCSQQQISLLSGEEKNLKIVVLGGSNQKGKRF